MKCENCNKEEGNVAKIIDAITLKKVKMMCICNTCAHELWKDSYIIRYMNA